MQDSHFTPAFGERMPGVEIHANIIQTLKEGKYIQDISKKLSIFLFVFCCMFVIVAVLYARLLYVFI